MNQFKDTLRRAKIVLMAIGLIYGGSALSDLAVDEAGDVRELNSISRRDTINLHPSAYENSKEAIGKGLVSMLSFLLYSYSKTPNRFKYESSQKSVSYLITVIIPFNDKIALRESMTDELISLYFQNQETLFIRLINHALPPGTSDIIHINSLEIVKKGDTIHITLGYSVISFNELKHFEKLVIKDISEICKNLFLEKLDRIGKEYLLSMPGSFEDIIKSVVNKQIFEKGLHKKSDL